jgi:hypothetical protein
LNSTKDLDPRKGTDRDENILYGLNDTVGHGLFSFCVPTAAQKSLYQVIAQETCILRMHIKLPIIQSVRRMGSPRFVNLLAA